MVRSRYGVRYLKRKQWCHGVSFYWEPPKKLKTDGLFRFVKLSGDFCSAAREAEEWNRKLDIYWLNKKPAVLRLGRIIPMTAADIAQKFEASPKFALLRPRTRVNYSSYFRRLEVHGLSTGARFGDLKVEDVSRQVAYGLYEDCLAHSGPSSANAIASAWQAAFKYATLRIPGMDFNPFSQLGRENPRPRRQRWTEEQIDAFVNAADEMGYSAIGRCALMCMELMQRPSDILDLKWHAYRQRERILHISQSKRGVEVRVPATRRLANALNAARRLARPSVRGTVDDALICPTVRGKRWEKRNFNRAVREIADAVGLPTDLQVRDLRRTAATEAADAGATAAELMAVGGWQNAASVRPYLVRTREQAATCQAKREAFRARRIAEARSRYSK